MLAQEVAHCCLSIEQTHRAVPLVRMQNLLYSLIGSAFLLEDHTYYTEVSPLSLWFDSAKGSPHPTRKLEGHGV
jgi:hypothetical protein